MGGKLPKVESPAAQTGIKCQNPAMRIVPLAATRPEVTVNSSMICQILHSSWTSDSEPPIIDRLGISVVLSETLMG
jgi:hypothetical protein